MSDTRGRPRDRVGVGGRRTRGQQVGPNGTPSPREARAAGARSRAARRLTTRGSTCRTCSARRRRSRRPHRRAALHPQRDRRRRGRADSVAAARDWVLRIRLGAMAPTEAAPPMLERRSARNSHAVSLRMPSSPCGSWEATRRELGEHAYGVLSIDAIAVILGGLGSRHLGSGMWLAGLGLAAYVTLCFAVLIGGHPRSSAWPDGGSGGSHTAGPAGRAAGTTGVRRPL